MKEYCHRIGESGVELILAESIRVTVIDCSLLFSP